VSYARSINRLARNEQTHAIIGSSIFIGWPREDFGFDFFALLNDPARAAVDALQGIQAALFKGKPMPKIDTNVFYATILSASGARVVVRDWIECAVPNLIEHLNRWFAWQRIVAPTGEFERPLGIRALAGATVRDLKDLPTPTVRALFRTALVGVPLPHNLLQQAIQRCRADRDVKHYQAAMLKLVLASRHYFEEDSMEHLDLDRPDVAYRCGRLLAVLEAVQGKAIPGINRTLVNRFLGSAMTSPERVFIPLVKGAEDHLSKLARQSQKGTAVNLQKQLEEIMLGINKFPQTFTSEQQAMFILGFYHQRAHDRKAATDHKQAKAAEAAQRTLPFHDDADHETDTV
jgi:CRISPR-associated protein Csd1